MSMIRLWRMLNKRGTAARSVDSHSSALAIVAFAAATAIFLTVLGGVHAFVWRSTGEHTFSCFASSRDCGPGISGAEAAGTDVFYVVLAIFASLMLLVPFATLAGSAARLCASRRDARLSALRLVGATNAQVTRLTAIDTTVQALLGALTGIAGYFALMPLIMLLPFQNHRFTFAQLWVGIPVLLATVAMVTIMALIASLSALRRVAITPLGVSARVGTAQPGKWRFLVVAAAFMLGFAALSHLGDLSAMFGQAMVFAIIFGVLAGCYALINMLGPWVISMRAKAKMRRPRNVETMIAMRRILDNPKRAWRNVSGIALAVFIAGITSVCSYFSYAAGRADTAKMSGMERASLTLMRDMGTGGLLTLAFAAVLAAVSCGIMQTGNVYDQESEYRALALEGVDAKTMNKARFIEVISPLAIVVAVSAACSMVLMLPLLGQLITQPRTLLSLVIGIAVCFALVSIGSFASNRAAAGLNLLEYRADD